MNFKRWSLGIKINPFQNSNPHTHFPSPPGRSQQSSTQSQRCLVPGGPTPWGSEEWSGRWRLGWALVRHPGDCQVLLALTHMGLDLVWLPKPTIQLGAGLLPEGFLGPGGILRPCLCSPSPPTLPLGPDILKSHLPVARQHSLSISHWECDEILACASAAASARGALGTL